MLKGPKRSFVVVDLDLGVESKAKNVTKVTKSVIAYTHGNISLKKIFVPMCTHSMELDSFYWAGIYGRPCSPLNLYNAQINSNFGNAHTIHVS